MLRNNGAIILETAVRNTHLAQSIDSLGISGKSLITNASRVGYVFLLPANNSMKYPASQDLFP
jgi:hypothetical protein